jgi:hypothetical protein
MTEEPRKVSRMWAFLVAVCTFITGAASGIVGSRYIPPLLDRADTLVGNELLYVYDDWPFGVCKPVPIAGMSEDPHPTTYTMPVDTITVAQLAPPIVHRQGWIRLTLSSPNSQTLTITDIEPQVFAQQESKPAWVLRDPSAVCGQSQQRLVDLTLAGGEARLVDKGEVGSGLEAPASAEMPSSSFTVSQTDPADIHVNVKTCDRYYEFGLTIYYTVNGREYEQMVGSREAPYRIVGGAAEATYISGSGPGPSRVGLVEAAQPAC